MTAILPRVAGPVLALLAATAACEGARDDDTSLVAAGDIAGCFWRGDEATARLLDRMGGIVAPLGDAVYSNGTPREFARCYHPTWGRHLERTRPAVGNHEYNTEGAAGYFQYFGARAGEPGKGWYSYDHDGWHVVVLNSEAPIEAGSEQLTWLARDLRAHRRTRCSIAYFHHPRFSSGRHGDRERVGDAFQVLYDGGVDVVLGGHDHHYERFAPQDPRGRLDRERGIRQFVVGTGGAPSYRLQVRPTANSETRATNVRGVLRLVFMRDGYEWEFVPVPGQRFHDEGRARCS